MGVFDEFHAAGAGGGEGFEEGFEDAGGGLGDVVAEARARLDPRVLRAQEAAIVAYHAAAPPSVPPDSPSVLAVSGSEDAVLPAANVERLAAMWPACRTEVVAGAGHAVMAQAPERVAALIRELR